MKFIKFLSLIFCFYILFQYVPSVYSTETIKEPTTLAEALKVYSTPFIDDYRARYVANDINKKRLLEIIRKNCRYSLDLELSPFQIACTLKDIENIKKLARYGDHASLALIPELTNDSEELKQKLKYAADMGEVESLAEYGFMVGLDNLTSGKIYIDKAKKLGNIEAYWSMAVLYFKHNIFDMYYSEMDEAYRIFGYYFILPSLLHNKKNELYHKKNKKNETKKVPSYVERRFNMTPKELLDEINTDESKLFKAFQYILDDEFSNANDLFQKIYDTTNNNEVKHNAGFCLGAIHYSGSIEKHNKKQGFKLMKDAIDNGYIVTFANIPGIQMMPEKYKIINYPVIMCEWLL